MTTPCPGPLRAHYAMRAPNDSMGLLVDCGDEGCDYVLAVTTSGALDEAHQSTPWARPEVRGGAR